MIEDSMNVVNNPASMNSIDIFANPKPKVYLLKNKQGMIAAVSNLGDTPLSLLVPDALGRLVEVICLAEEHLRSGAGFAGNNCMPPNWDLKQKFTEKEYLVYLNKRLEFLQDNRRKGQVALNISQPKNTTIVLIGKSHQDGTDSDGDFNINIAYSLSGNNGLKISRETTILNEDRPGITNQIFFNLNGSGNGSILNHVVQINADNYLTTDEMCRLTLTKENVTGTPFDFSKATAIGARINDNNEQLKNCAGYNHNFLLNRHTSRTPVAKIKGDQTGIVMQVCTEDPALLFYSGNLIQNQVLTSEIPKGFYRNAFVMEPGVFAGVAGPGAVQLISPGQVYRTSVIYQFG